MSVRLCLSALASLLLSTAAARADEPTVHAVGVEGQVAAAPPTVRAPLTAQPDERAAVRGCLRV